MIQIFDPMKRQVVIGEEQLDVDLHAHGNKKRSWQALRSNRTMESECYKWKQVSAIHSETYTQEFE